AKVVARIQRVGRTERRDQVVYLDVEVVDGDGQARSEARREHDTVGVRVRCLRLQGRVAACIELVLTRRAGAQLAIRDSSTTGRVQTGVVRGSALGAARVGAQVEQTEALCSEQLHDVWRACGALEAGTKADVFDGRVLHTELVGIGRDTRAVVRGAISGIERQLFDASLALHLRDAGLHEEV